MDRTDGRLSLAVLVAGAALVLAAGTAWWMAADPTVEAEPIPTAPPVALPEPVAPEQVDNGSDSYLPEFANTVQRSVGRLDPNESSVMEVPSEKGSEYRLQYVCLGPGDLSVRVRGTTDGEILYQLDCEGNLNTFQYIAADTIVVVEVHRPGPEPADIGVQVIAVK
ncbi:hypothetical protein GCM10022251_05310 [Phytohabitans flavus]|uniref:Uncharacterized protein n=1 Tax=Phytohabitans flavus TaxID=1076124 RepID=A0A6F8Y2N1_9ACTN|nr:DUF6023 family protein [Phytohabitans flavus]BCB80307.1 hypothetical protein Pflav_067170 [Phytohabitans flavus]